MIVAEPATGRGRRGGLPPDPATGGAIAPVLRKHNILLIFDEVICGLWPHWHHVRDAAVRRHPAMLSPSPRGLPQGTSPWVAWA